MLVDPAARRCDLYRRGADGLWVLHPGAPEQGARLWDEVPPVTAEAGTTR